MTDKPRRLIAAHTAPAPYLGHLNDPATYDGEPICDRCGSGWPCCADYRPDGTRYTHAETCATYNWANALCNNCEKELAR